METRTWKIVWNEEMSVGIHEIDADHKRFILLIDDLNRAIVDRMDLEEIKRRLQLILDDTARHFAHEEKLFREWRYPDADEHAKKHASVINSLQAIQDQLFAYSMTSEWINVWLKVKDILINHLLTEDMKYAEFYRNSLKAHGKQ
jgi:hemerythrin-like metal-binding protein